MRWQRRIKNLRRNDKGLIVILLSEIVERHPVLGERKSMPTTRSFSVTSLLQVTLMRHVSTTPRLNQFWLNSAEEVERLAQCFTPPGCWHWQIFPRQSAWGLWYARGEEKLVLRKFLGVDHMSCSCINCAAKSQKAIKSLYPCSTEDRFSYRSRQEFHNNRRYESAIWGIDLTHLLPVFMAKRVFLSTSGWTLREDWYKTKKDKRKTSMGRFRSTRGSWAILTWSSCMYKCQRHTYRVPYPDSKHC